MVPIIKLSHSSDVFWQQIDGFCTSVFIAVKTQLNKRKCDSPNHNFFCLLVPKQLVHKLINHITPFWCLFGSPLINEWSIWSMFAFFLSPSWNLLGNAAVGFYFLGWFSFYDLELSSYKDLVLLPYQIPLYPPKLPKFRKGVNYSQVPFNRYGQSWKHWANLQKNE